MARGVNKVILVGNLGLDPVVKQLDTGKMITRLSVATSEGWKDKATDTFKERTEWHRVVLFDRLAEIASQYLRKGSKVYIVGRLRTTKWQDQEQRDRYTTEVVAREMQMLDSKSGDTSTTPPLQPKPKQSTASSIQPQVQDNEPPFLDDDDIPF